MYQDRSPLGYSGLGWSFSAIKLGRVVAWQKLPLPHLLSSAPQLAPHCSLCESTSPAGQLRQLPESFFGAAKARREGYKVCEDEQRERGQTTQWVCWKCDDIALKVEAKTFNLVTIQVAEYFFSLTFNKLDCICCCSFYSTLATVTRKEIRSHGYLGWTSLWLTAVLHFVSVLPFVSSISVHKENDAQSLTTGFFLLLYE